MKYLKILIIFFSILLFNSCGYNNINSKKLNDFKINKLEINGEKKLTSKVKNNIDIYSSQNSKFIYEVQIKLVLNKKTKIKNTAGKTIRYSIELQADTLITNTSTQNVYEKTFSSINDYNVASTHSDTLNNEKNAIENATNYISNEIVKYLKLLNV